MLNAHSFRTALVLFLLLFVSAAGCSGSASEKVEYYIDVWENGTQVALSGARVVMLEPGDEQPRELVTDANGSVTTPVPAEGTEIHVFHPGHVPTYFKLASGSTSTTVLTDPLQVAEATSQGAWSARGQPLGVVPQDGSKSLSFQVRYIRPAAEEAPSDGGGTGSIAQMFFQGEIPGGSLLMLTASRAAELGASIDVYFIDAETGKSIAKADGAMYADAIQVTLPDLPAAPEGIWVIAMADLAANQGGSAGANTCCPSGVANCTCDDGPVMTGAEVNCCSSPGGAGCSSTVSISVSGSVTVTVPDAGAVTITVNLTTSSTCSASAKTCLYHRLGSRGCAYIRCAGLLESLWGITCPASLTCPYLCTTDSCSFPKLSCPAGTCHPDCSCTP